MRTKKWK